MVLYFLSKVLFNSTCTILYLFSDFDRGIVILRNQQSSNISVPENKVFKHLFYERNCHHKSKQQFQKFSTCCTTSISQHGTECFGFIQQLWAWTVNQKVTDYDCNNVRLIEKIYICHNGKNIVTETGIIQIYQYLS